MPTLHTDSLYYDQLSTALDIYFTQAYDQNYDLLPHETATWFDGEEAALPDSPLGVVQKKILEAGGPAKGYRHLHMWKRVTKDNLVWEKVVLIAVPEKLCYEKV